MKLIVKENKTLLNYLLENTDYTKTKIKSLFKYKNISVNSHIPANLNINIRKNEIIEISKEKKNKNI